MKTELLNYYICEFMCDGNSTVVVHVVAPTFGKAASIAIAHLSSPEFQNYDLHHIFLSRPIVVESSIK